MLRLHYTPRTRAVRVFAGCSRSDTVAVAQSIGVLEDHFPALLAYFRGLLERKAFQRAVAD